MIATGDRADAGAYGGWTLYGLEQGQDPDIGAIAWVQLALKPAT
jgi:hypothetical protein